MYQFILRFVTKKRREKLAFLGEGDCFFLSEIQAWHLGGGGVEMGSISNMSRDEWWGRSILTGAGFRVMRSLTCSPAFINPCHPVTRAILIGASKTRPRGALKQLYGWTSYGHIASCSV